MGTGAHGGKSTNRMSFGQSKEVADKIAQSMGWKDHADALAHRDKDGKVGHGPNYSSMQKSKDKTKHNYKGSTEPAQGPNRKREKKLFHAMGLSKPKPIAKSLSDRINNFIEKQEKY